MKRSIRIRSSREDVVDELNFGPVSENDLCICDCVQVDDFITRATRYATECREEDELFF